MFDISGGGSLPYTLSSISTIQNHIPRIEFTSIGVHCKNTRVWVFDPGFTDEVGRKVERIRVCSDGLAA